MTDTTRDQLARDLKTVHDRSSAMNYYLSFWDGVAGDLLEMGWRPPARRIETSDELDALPAGSVVSTDDDGPRIFECAEHLANPFTRDGCRSVWWETGRDAEFTTREIPLPATVLHELIVEAGR